MASKITAAACKAPPKTTLTKEQTEEASECIDNLKNWLRLYLFTTLIKYCVVAYQYCLFKDAIYSSIASIRKAERRNEEIQIFTYVYVNGLFLAMLILGNIMYYSIDRQEIK